MFNRNVLSNDVLSYRLDHVTRVTSTESVWDHLTRNNLLKENYHSINRAKNYLRALAFCFIDLDKRNVFKDKKKLQVIKVLHKDTVILNPHKDNGVPVIVTKTMLSNLQSYLRKLNNRSEIAEEVYQEIRPKKTKVSKAQGLPKVNKSFEILPSFRPIIDTIGFTHCNVEKYITKLLNRFTQNKCSLKDTFDAAERIKKIPKELVRNKQNTLILLDVVSLFTNLPIQQNVSIILDCVYNQKLIRTTLSKKVLKNLILDIPRRPLFTFSNIIY